MPLHWPDWLWGHRSQVTGGPVVELRLTSVFKSITLSPVTCRTSLFPLGLKWFGREGLSGWAVTMHVSHYLSPNRLYLANRQPAKGPCLASDLASRLDHTKGEIKELQ